MDWDGFGVSSEVFLSVCFVFLGVSLLAVGFVVFRWRPVGRGVEPAAGWWFSVENERLERVVAEELLRLEDLSVRVGSSGFDGRISGLWGDYAEACGRSFEAAETHGELSRILVSVRECRLRLERVMEGLSKEGA